MTDLTARQAEILGFIIDHRAATGFPPSIREIGDRFEIRSTNGVNDHLRALEKKGRIRRQPMISRGIQVVHEEEPAQYRIEVFVELRGETWDELRAAMDRAADYFAERTKMGKPITAVGPGYTITSTR